ncbi:phosphatidate cytidylyltransferase [Methyloversatilis universalis]|uniref:phosphatidate cytidylyltransferase n=1 Tax=Methyloversatilis universalis TaxID=378211 RepID=UPI0003829260|nr:phosphatidate cytidylyltransferase [Methyloversatilis universalis]
MTAQQTFYVLMGGIAAVLALASGIGAVLGRRAGEGARAVVDNLNARIRAWWVMVGVFALAYLLGPTATIVMFALVSWFALREFMTLTPTRPGDHRALSVAFFIAIPLQYLLIARDWYGLFSILIPVYGFLLLPSLSVLAQDTGDFLARAAKIQWGVMLTVYCISHVPALLLLDIPGYEGRNALLLFYMMLVVQLSDVLQYVFGKLFGRTKIAPVVSPSKTVEGFVGGALSATAVGAAMWWITPFSPLQAAGMAAAIVLMGFLGGLVLSAVKRSLGAKDWGRMIEGHGGMMDRMDSVSFAAPVFFHLTRYFFTP